MSTQRKGLAGRRLAWVVSNGGFAWALWAWHAQGSEGARHLATGWVWFGFVASFLLVLNEDAVAKLRERGPSVPIWLNGWVDAVLVVALMWWGEAWLSSAYLVHALLVHGAMKGERRK